MSESNVINTASTTNGVDEIHRAVQASYGARALIANGNSNSTGCCNSSGGKNTCCWNKATTTRDYYDKAATKMGYTEQDLASVPDESNLGLGCGAPLQVAQIKKGMTVLDLGSGAGFDCFLAANYVGPTGHVIGVDMTPEMIKKAKENLTKKQSRLLLSSSQKSTPTILPQIDFVHGYIEKLPIEDNTIDVIISNCVINLSPDKDAVFREAYRVLKSDTGKICVSDIVLLEPLPDVIRTNLSAYMGCIAGATLLDDYIDKIKHAGFVNIDITTKQAFHVLACDDPIVQGVLRAVDENKLDLEKLKLTVVSATIVAYKK